MIKNWHLTFGSSNITLSRKQTMLLILVELHFMDHFHHFSEMEKFFAFLSLFVRSTPVQPRG